MRAAVGPGCSSICWLTPRPALNSDGLQQNAFLRAVPEQHKIHDPWMWTRGRQGGGETPWKQDAAWKEISVGVLVGNPGVGGKARGATRQKTHFLPLSSLCPVAEK